MNGFVLGSWQTEIHLGRNNLANLADTNCWNFSSVNHASCNYHPDYVSDVEQFRIKVRFPDITGNVELIYQTTFSINSPTPSPTCPEETGCYEGI